MVIGTLKGHFVPSGPNIDVITLEVDGTEVDYYLPPNLTTQHWPFARLSDRPQVRIETHPIDRQDAGSRGTIEVVTAFEYLS